MLKEFRVKNFLSFKDEQVFSMEACPERQISELPDHVAPIGDQRILKLASFYGPNGGGKSNLIKAINTLQLIVLGHAIPMSSFSNRCTFHHSFLSDDFSTLAAYFANEDGEVGYELEVRFIKGQIPNSPTPIAIPEIKREEMICRKKGASDWSNVFVRDQNGRVKGETLGTVDLVANKRSLNPNITFLGYIGTMLSAVLSRDERLGSMISLFKEFKSIFTFNNVFAEGYAVQSNVAAVPPSLPDETLQALVEFLRQVDIPVEKITLEQTLPFQAELMFHRRLKDGTAAIIPFNMESAGTKKLTSFFLQVLSRKDVEIILADDFDAALHPSLVSAILKYFGSSASGNRQLIANSHDILNMTNQHFRRDEIWFASRDESYQTVLMSLANIVNYEGKQIRKDAKYGKQYLEGLYGADPFIQKGVRIFNA